MDGCVREQCHPAKGRTDTTLCRGKVHLTCQRGEVEIELTYEPFGPPWCHIRRTGRFERNLHIESDFSGFGSGTLLRTHDEQIEDYCRKLLRRLEDVQIAA